jgi:hypothetical protein
MQPIKYLNGVPGGLGNPDVQKLMRYDFLVYQDANGQRQTIPNPLKEQGLQGLGFISSIIGAGAKLIGGLIGKNKDKQAPAPAPAPAASAAPQQQPGFLQRVASNLIPAPGNGSMLSQFSGGGNGVLQNLQSQIADLQNASKFKEQSFNSFIDKQKDELDEQNKMLVQSNAEVRRLLDNANQLRQATEQKVEQLKDVIKAQRTREQLRDQEAKLKDEIRRTQQPDNTGKVLTYAGIALATVFAVRSLNGSVNGLSGTDSAPTTGRKSKSKVKTVTI